MKQRHLLFSLTCLFGFWDSEPLSARNRKNDRNILAWFNTHHTLHLNENIAASIEYQWRRTDGIKNWQQSLFRTGIQYNLPMGFKALIGYAWAETFPYGAYPLTQYFPFPEHRIFEQITWDDQQGPLLLNHRARLEQRFLGALAPSTKGEREVGQWNYMNRLRYQLKAIIPLNNKTLTDNTFYATAYDEIFIGFGKNVNLNVFDQNRMGITLGYKFKSKISIEAGWFNQTLQQARPIDNQPVYQYNQGFILNLLANWN